MASQGISISDKGSDPASWRKLGLIYDASRHVCSWRQHSALTPTPLMKDDGSIRVYAGFRDKEGVSRIGWVDLEPADPCQILGISQQPALDIGRPGCFDDNGVILGDVVRHGREILLAYVGFQAVAKAKFLAFSGLACSIDGGDSFERVSEAPILDRTHGETTIAAIHTLRFEAGRWRIWYAHGNAWQPIGDGLYPIYGVGHVETTDLRHIVAPRIHCIAPQYPEYRLGRPRVYRRKNGSYFMHFTAGTVDGGYFPGIATSEDGIRWTRAEVPFELPLSTAGWDSRQLAYPAIIEAGGREYMFYNGNDMGRDGFGVAVRETAAEIPSPYMPQP